MSEINRAAVFGKLNTIGYKSIESATLFCKMRGNRYVELVHWLHQILQTQDSDLHRIVNRFELNSSRLAKDFTSALDRLTPGAGSVTNLSSDVEQAVERGWIYATLMFGEAQVRTGHLLVGILKADHLRNTLYGISQEFKKISPDALTDHFDDIVGGSPEDKLQATDGFRLSSTEAEAAEGPIPPVAMGKQQALHRFALDLTERARKGDMDPVVGRDAEIRRMIDILMRRRQNNPILTGEAGVGKTAVVEGLALRIAAGNVPPPLREVSLFNLDLGLLQAGASMKGEFEERLRNVIEEVQSSEKPIILFIDEAHTLIGAGGTAGAGDAANLLKPALARGTLRTVAATTWAEYKKYIEKDPALTRRFQVVRIAEPSEENAILMMRGIGSKMEEHHRVQVLDEALEAAVKLSRRYIPDRQLPDKSVSVLDTAAARVAVSQHAVPAMVEDSRRHIENLELELGIIEKEKAVGMDVDERRAAVAEALAQERPRLGELERRWSEEQALVERILGLRRSLRQGNQPVEGTGSKLEQATAEAKQDVPEGGASAADPVLAETATGGVGESTEGAAVGPSRQQRQAMLDELKGLQTKLHHIQGERPLILPTVDAQAVAAVIGDWTGIPVGRMVKNEIEAVLHLAETLNRRVVGQSHALESIARRIQTSRARLDNPNKPVGVFLLAGPSGVGKTETALALAEALYGGEENLVTINMSEFQEAHTVSTLKGAPPGYVGYGEGGILTEAVRRRPYSVVLLDEVEKAHPDVHEIFFQVFDKGWMEDAEGRYIDFRNTVILLTSNAGSDTVMGMCKDPERMPEADALAQALRPPLLKVFPAALLGRLVVIPYYPLGDDVMARIAVLQLDRIVRRIADNHKITLSYDDAVVKLIIDRCAEIESGGRMIDAILTNTLLPAISTEILNAMMDGRPMERIEMSVKGGEFHYRYGSAK